MISPGFVGAEEIVADVSKKYGVACEVIMGKRRTRTVVAARHCAIRRIRKETTLSLFEIGDLFEMDHTTVIYILKKGEG